MVKRSIGIDIGYSHLRAVQISNMDEKFHIEKVFQAQTRRSTDSPATILRSLLGEEGFDWHANMAIAMPHDSIFFRTLETDNQNLELLGNIEHNQDNINSDEVTNLLNDSFAILPDNRVVKVHSSRKLQNNNLSVLTAATDTDAIDKRLDTLADVGMTPDLIEAAIFAIHTSVNLNHPEIAQGKAIIACIDESFLLLAVLEDNNILAVRNIPILAENIENIESPQDQVEQILLNEAQITWQKLFEQPIERETKIFLVAIPDLAADTQAVLEEKINCRVIMVDPYAVMECPDKSKRDAPICLAQGLALRALKNEKGNGTNFLDTETAKAKPKTDLKKEFKVFLILIAAIAVASVAALFLRLSALEIRNAHVNSEIENLFREVLPEEKNIVNPLAQLETKLKSMQATSIPDQMIGRQNTGPLELLLQITQSSPAEHGIKITDILIAGQSVRLTGTAKSFNAPYDWQHKLQQIPQFATVKVHDNIQRQSNSKLINFTISMSPETTEQQI